MSSTADESVSRTDAQDEENTRAEETTEWGSQPCSLDAQSGPPVPEGEVREVDIESLCGQGDGIIKMDRVIRKPPSEEGNLTTVGSCTSMNI
jgi:hypothetical protein